MRMRWMLAGVVFALLLGCGEDTQQPEPEVTQEAVATQNTDDVGPALVQVFVLGLSVFNMEATDDLLLGAYFPEGENHLLSMWQGRVDGSDLVFDPLRRPGQLAGVKISPVGGSGLSIPGGDPTPIGGFPSSVSDAENPKWMVNAKHIHGTNVAFNPPAEVGTWLLFGDYDLETCALALDQNLTEACLVESENSNLKPVAISEVMVLRARIDETEPGARKIFDVLGQANGIEVNRITLPNCDQATGADCVTWDSHHYKYLYDIAVVHVPPPVQGPTTRALETKHPDKLRKYFGLGNQPNWGLQVPRCDDDMVDCNCQALQPSCWGHFSSYSLRPWELSLMSPLDVAICPIVEYP